MTTRVEYLIGDDIIEIINKAAYNHLKPAEYSQFEVTGVKQFELRTGMAGYQQFDKCIKTMCLTSGLVIGGSDIIPTYNSYSAPFLGTFKCILDSELDYLNISIDDNRVDNPWINGWRLSSYSYKLTESNTDNIVEIIPIGIKEVTSTKFYWVSIKVTSLVLNDIKTPDKTFVIEECIDIHPFQYMQHNNPINKATDFKLLNWKEITKEEYNLFNKLNPQD